MNLMTAVDRALSGRAVLFLGAGASYGATNAKQQSLPSGMQLNALLAKECRLPDDTPLDRAAEFYIDDFGEEQLITLLKDRLSVGTIADHHVQLAQVDWLRVYTTNYDNVYEQARRLAKLPIESNCLSQSPEELRQDIQQCLHINGSIASLSAETLHNEFKLSTSSYLTHCFHESKWVDTFRVDLKIADFVFFVGYSMYDIDIQRLVFSTPELRAKTFFVVSPQERQDTERVLSKLGSVEKIGVEYFGKILSTALQKRPKHTDKGSVPLSRWNLFAPDTSRASAPDDGDILSLLLWGNFSPAIYSYCHRTSDAPPYVFQRNVAAVIVNDLVENERDIIIHSNMGNGKSVIQHMLCEELYDKGYKVFSIAEDVSDEAIREGRSICESAENPTVMVLPVYPSCIDLVNDLSVHRRSHVRLLLFARSSANDITFTSLRESLRDNTKEVSADKLHPLDIRSAINYLELHAIWGELAGRTCAQKELILRDKCKSEVSSLLLLLLDSPQVSSSNAVNPAEGLPF